MDKLNITNPVDKYYSLNKFKYLPGMNVNQNAHIDGRVDMYANGYIEPRKRHNKMSYCNTC